MAQLKDINISPDMIAEVVKRAMAAMNQSTGEGVSTITESGKLDAGKDYPLGANRPDLVKSASGLAIDDIVLEKVINNQIKFDDIKIRAETLEYQAQISESSGRPILASNLRRASEMTRIPDERLLEMYNSLRPYRCTKREMMDMADELETKYQAKICADFIREAADVYEQRGRLKQ